MEVSIGRLYFDVPRGGMMASDVGGGDCIGSNAISGDVGELEIQPKIACLKVWYI